jgi:hypothetical protein
MSKKPQSKDEALEALDFIVNVLKEHEKDLDRLISELGTVTDQLGETGELSGKVERVEEKIGNLQNEVTNLLSFITKSRKEQLPIIANVEPKTQVSPVIQTPTAPTIQAPVSASVISSGPSIILRCKQWEDFQTLAHQAQTLSFMYKEAERSFQADALKGNQIITYSGELPKFTSLLKMWLSKQLEVPEMKILEGVLAIG